LGDDGISIVLSATRERRFDGLGRYRVRMTYEDVPDVRPLHDFDGGNGSSASPVGSLRRPVHALLGR